MKKLFVLILCLAALSVAGVVGYRGYHWWKERHLMRQARMYLRRGDGSNAYLSLRQAVIADPNNLEACKLLAQILEMGRSPEALNYALRVVDLEPNNITNRLYLARVAMGLNNAKEAAKALDGLDAAGKQTAIYHKMLGTLLLAEHRGTEAETQFIEVTRLEPTNIVNFLNLAILRLQHTNQQAVALARTTLINLCTNSEVRPDALRQLVQDAIRHTNIAAVLSYSGKLVAETNATFSDRLSHLQFLHLTTNAQEAAYLAVVQRECTTNSARSFEVGRWMFSTGNPQGTLNWLHSLPLSTRTNLPVPILEADCQMALKQWPLLATNLASQNWADKEFLRHLTRSRSFREQGSITSAKTEWLQALSATGDRLDLLGELLRNLGPWKWHSEEEEVLWDIANHYPNERWVVQALSDRLFAAGNTLSLQRLFSLALQQDQTNLALMNNLASTAILTESWDKKPHELAKEVYDKAPTNAAYATTYALSLMVQKRNADALKVMDKIPAKFLEDPGIALYYGLILKANGGAAKAGKYFDIAAKGRLLPEEQKLLDRARHS